MIYSKASIYSNFVATDLLDWFLNQLVDNLRVHFEAAGISLLSLSLPSFHIERSINHYQFLQRQSFLHISCNSQVNKYEAIHFSVLKYSKAKDFDFHILSQILFYPQLLKPTFRLSINFISLRYMYPLRQFENGSDNIKVLSLSGVTNCLRKATLFPNKDFQQAYGKPIGNYYQAPSIKAHGQKFSDFPYVNHTESTPLFCMCCQQSGPVIHKIQLFQMQAMIIRFQIKCKRHFHFCSLLCNRTMKSPIISIFCPCLLFYFQHVLLLSVALIPSYVYPKHFHQSGRRAAHPKILKI